MSILRGIYRLTALVIIIGVGTLLIIPTIWIPFRVNGIKPSAWGVTVLARLILFVFKIYYFCPEPEKFRQLHGFVFPNHSSFLDPVMVAHLIPMRFVAKQEIRWYPVVGLIGIAINTVWVKRSSKESRNQARAALAKAERFPPIVLFPEGKTGPGDKLQPFRKGAFEIAVENEIPYLPCVILFDKPEYVRWRGDKFLKVAWRLASRSGPLTAKLVALDVVHPTKDDDPEQLSAAAHKEMSAVLEKGIE
jgi:1-acyl-sn-glycerol-3-phosphate acyltransferase